MDNFVFKHNKQGYFDLMKSPKMQGILKTYSQQIKGRAEGMGQGAEFATDLKVQKTRARAYVVTANQKAKEQNAKNNILEKATH